MPLTLSYSSLGTFLSCPRRFMYTKCSGLELERRNSAASLIGTAIHESFQYYLITRDFDKSLKLLMMKYPLKLKKAMSGKYHFLTAFNILKELVKWYEESGYDLLYINGKPAVEFMVDTKYQLNGTKFLKELNWLGFIDAIFIDRETGELIICDIKTSSTTSSPEEDNVKYSLSPQTVEYVTNVLNLLGYSQNEVREVISTVKVLYLVCRFNGLEYEVSPLYFSKDPSCIDNLENGIRQLVDCIERNQEDSSKYYRSGSCISFGQVCPFFELCSNGVDYPISINNTQEEKKNPFNTKQINKTILINHN